MGVMNAVRGMVCILVVVCTAALPTMSLAQQTTGAVTKLPLPRFVSTKVSEAFARRGPGPDHKIDWRFLRRDLPLKVVAEHGHWRRVEDAEGQGGWIHYALLSRARTVLVTTDGLDMYAKPTGQSHLVARLSRDVVAKLVGCKDDMCEIAAKAGDGSEYDGWVAREGLWGLVEGD